MSRHVELESVVLAETFGCTGLLVATDMLRDTGLYEGIDILKFSRRSAFDPGNLLSISLLDRLCSLSGCHGV